MSLPYALMPLPRQQFLDADANPYAGGSLYFYVAGTSTPKTVYADAAGAVPLGTSVVLDAGGYAPAIFLSPGGHKVVLRDANAVTIWTVDNVEDVGLTFWDRLGEELLAGALGVSSGYVVLTDDLFVTISSTGGPNPCVITLPAASAHPQPLCLKNAGTIPCSIVPNGGDTIEGINEAYTLAAGATPNWPTVWLMADGSSSWWIVASHGF